MTLKQLKFIKKIAESIIPEDDDYCFDGENYYTEKVGHDRAVQALVEAIINNILIIKEIGYRKGE